MSQQEPEPVYCSVQDVGDLINLEITDNSKPSITQVKKLINNKQAHIDRETKHSWRSTKVDEEVKDLEGVWHSGHGYIIGLQHRYVKTLDYVQGDRLQYWNGNDWQNILQADNTLSDGVKVNYIDGSFELEAFALAWSSHKRYRVIYRYGETVVPNDIRECCAKLVAMDIISGSMFWNSLPIGGDKFNVQNTVDIWKDDTDRIIANNTEVVAVY